jgi:hypothetical protein
MRFAAICMRYGWKPGIRVTFSTWKHYSKDSPLLESGLLGPVRLRTALRQPLGNGKMAPEH